jgi:hypothetical protein
MRRLRSSSVSIQFVHHRRVPCRPDDGRDLPPPLLLGGHVADLVARCAANRWRCEHGVIEQLNILDHQTSLALHRLIEVGLELVNLLQRRRRKPEKAASAKASVLGRRACRRRALQQLARAGHDFPPHLTGMEAWRCRRCGTKYARTSVCRLARLGPPCAAASRVTCNPADRPVGLSCDPACLDRVEAPLTVPCRCCQGCSSSRGCFRTQRFTRASGCGAPLCATYHSRNGRWTRVQRSDRAQWAYRSGCSPTGRRPVW